MNENLMVNSKTDILEFKRKHNLLVANGTIKANVSNIKTLSNDVINNLRCGDVVLKEDSTEKHAYLVSFKSDTGLCLTYVDASCVETQSYDKSGNNWVYNSEDKSVLPVNIGNPIQVFDGELTLTSALTIVASYCKVVRNFNELQFIFNCRVKNETETTMSLLNDSPVCSFELPDKILEVIYGHDGANLLNRDAPISIAYTALYVSNTIGTVNVQNPRYVNLYYRNDINAVRMYLEGYGIDIASNEVLDLEARISLAL